jgi:hypothetical protein
VAFPVVMRPEAWEVFMALPEPAHTEGIELLCELTQGPTAVADASYDDFGRYSKVLTGRYSWPSC